MASGSRTRVLLGAPLKLASFPSTAVLSSSSDLDCEWDKAPLEASFTSHSYSPRTPTQVRPPLLYT